MYRAKHPTRCLVASNREWFWLAKTEKGIFVKILFKSPKRKLDTELKKQWFPKKKKKKTTPGIQRVEIDRECHEWSFFMSFIQLKIQSPKIESLIEPIWGSYPKKARHLQLQCHGGYTDWWQMISLKNISPVIKEGRMDAAGQKTRVVTLTPKDTRVWSWPPTSI